MISKLVLFSFYLNCVLCSITHYKASVVDVSKTDFATNEYESLILEAAESNVDLLVLSRTKLESETFDSCATDQDNYDEVVKLISKATKSAGIYVVAPVYEKLRCLYRDETIFNNVVFGRDGGIVAAYRTPVNIASKCNLTESKIVKFTTDFDVTFALVAEEDIFIHRIEYFDDIRNFIVSGFASNIPSLLAEQFTASWSFVNNINVVSPSGLFGGNVEILDYLIVAEFEKSGGSSSLFTTSSTHEGLHYLHHNTKILNTEASSQGFTDTVCDGSFCCNFYLKMSDMDSSLSHYALSAHSDMVQLGHQKVALQACVVSANQNTDMKFDKITITANFTKDSAQFPSVTTTEPTIINNLFLENNSAELYDTNILAFSVLSRDYNNDNGIEVQNKTNIDTKYITYKNVNDFFDYVWITVRVPIFIVSIYILEML